MSFLQYYIDRCLIFLMRSVVALGTYINRRGRQPQPDEVRYIASRDAGRTIKVHIYRASSAGPSPVLLNFHGSGFVLPQHGSDDEFCHQMSRETKYTVLDLPYRLAPENPFPAALNDVEDAINYALGRPDEFDASHISLSGFSAGANLVLAASANLYPENTFRSLIAFYPVTDLTPYSSPKVAPRPEEKRKIPRQIARLFDRCYVPAGVDRRDPRISVRYAQLDRFPRRMLMITADGDTLAPEAEDLASRLSQTPGFHVVSERMAGCSHGWDKTTRAGSPQQHVEAKERAYGLAVEMLNEE